MPRSPLLTVVLDESTDASILRKLFNDLQLSQRAARGEIAVIIEEDVLIQHALIPHPPGTRRQRVAYRDPSGLLLARAIQFVLPDGSLGASGKPDPKLIRNGDIVYKLKRFRR